MLSMKKHLLRVGNSIGATQHPAAATADNDDDNEHYHERVATLVLHDMGGIVHRRKSCTVVSNPVCESTSDVNKRRSVVHLSKRVRSFGKRTQHSNDEEELNHHDNMVSSAESDHPAAKIVIWCEEQHEVKGRRKSKASSSTPKYLYSCPIIEETIDDEGNVLTWSCAWTGNTAGRSFYIPLKNEGTSLCVGIGLQYSHDEKTNDIQHIGKTSVNIGEDGEHFLSLPVESFKQKNRMFGKLAAAASSFKSSKDIEYLVSPSTVLNANLRVGSSSQRIFDTLVNDSASTSEYHSTPLAALYIIKNDHEYDTETTSNALEEENQKYNKLCNQQNATASISIGGSKTSKTVKATNMTCYCIHYPPDDESIESEGSVLNGNLAKNRVVIDDLFEKEADEEEYEDEMKPGHILALNPIEEDDDDDIRILPPAEDRKTSSEIVMCHEEEGVTREVEISKERCTPTSEDEDDDEAKAQSPEEEELKDQEYEILDHKPLLSYIELEEVNLKENDDEDSLTLGSFEAVETVLPTKEERVEAQLNVVCNELKILEQMLEEASDGVADIINCGLFKDTISDDITCQTNCTMETYDISYQSVTVNGSIISTNDTVNDSPEEESVQSVNEEESIQSVNEESNVVNEIQRNPTVRIRNSIFSKVTKKQQSGSSSNVGESGSTRSIKSCKSLGRSLTSEEKELLLEKYNCDGNDASVYSV